MERKFLFSESGFFTFFLLMLPISSFTGNPVEEASQGNIDAARNLWHYSENYEKIPENPPSFENPVVFSQAKIFGAVPEVSGRINSGESTSFVFGWGESHAGRLETSLPNQNCPATRLALLENGVRQELNAEFKFNGMQKGLLLNSPLVPVPFSRDELEAGVDKDEKSGKALENMINVSLSGSVYFDYERVEEGYNYVCRRKCAGKTCHDECGCDYYRKTLPVIFAREVSDNRSFLVEAANLDYFVARPGLLENTLGANFLEVVVFSRERLQNMSVFKGGSLIAGRAIHGFGTMHDAFGIAHVYAGDETGNSKEISHEEAWSSPSIAMQESRNFSHVYRIKKEADFDKGENLFEVRATNDFFREKIFNFPVITKEKTATVARKFGDGGEAGIFEAEVYDSSGKKAVEGLETENPGFVALAYFSGDGYYLPSAGVRESGEGMLVSGENSLLIAALIFVGLGFWIGRRPG